MSTQEVEEALPLHRGDETAAVAGTAGNQLRFIWFLVGVLGESVLEDGCLDDSGGRAPL